MSEDAAPTAELERLVEFVNSHGSDFGDETLRSPAALTEWLRSRGLLDTDHELTDADLDAALTLREQLRAALAAHHDHIIEGAPPATSVTLRLEIAADGSASLVPAGTPLERALGQLVAPIPAAVADGTWDRMKVCPSQTCQWAFYDRSRNRSRRWCAMDVCGNRHKSRAFRERHRDED